MKILKSCLTILAAIGLTLSAGAQTPDIGLAITSNNEKDLDGAVLTLTMNVPKLVRDGDISPLAVDLMNAPAGLSVVSVTSSGSGATGTVVLAFTPGDFDTDSTNFHVSVHDTVLDIHVTTLSDTITLVHNLEQVSATPNPAQLVEDGFDGADIDVYLTNEEFVAGGNNLDPEDFELVNFPPGVTIKSIYGPQTDKDQARLLLEFDTTDYDVNYTGCYVSIQDSVLLYSSEPLNTPAFTVNGNDEYLSYSGGLPLGEASLDGDQILFKLMDDKTNVTGSDINKTKFTLLNVPAGVEIQQVNSDGDDITVIFDYDGTDFDADSTHCKLSVDPAILTWNTGDTLNSPEFTINAVVDLPAATISDVNPVDFTEYTLDNTVLTITVSNDTFNLTTLLSSHFIVPTADRPAGFSFDQVTKTSNSTVELTIDWTYDDFDANYPDFHVEIDDIVLTQTSGTDLSTDSILLDAIIENPSSTLTPVGGDLKEYHLNNRTLNLVLSQEWLQDTTGFSEDNLTILDSPPGLAIGDAWATGDSNIVIILDSTSYVDFDVFDILELSINSGLLVQQPSSSWAVDTTVVRAVDENPVSTLAARDSILEEYELDQRVLDLWLGEEWISDTAGFDQDDMTLADIPPGIDGFTAYADDSANVVITLDAPWASYEDFDADTVLKFSIKSSVLVQSPGGLELDTATVHHYLETPVSTLTARDSILEEYELDQRVLDLWLGEEWISNPVGFNQGAMTLSDLPPGIDGFTAYADDSANVVITLSSPWASYEDFDADTVLKFSINSSILVQSPGGMALDTATLHHYLENPQAILTPDQPTFYEYDLDGRFVDIFLFEEWIEDTASFSRDDITLMYGPSGLEINDISITDSANFRVTLYDTITDYDFDTDHNLKVSIKKNKLIQVRDEVSDLETNSSVPVIGHEEIPAIYDTPSGWLREWWMDTMSIDLKFFEEKFRYNVTVTKDHFHINGGPEGLSVKGIRNLADSSVTVDLLFDKTDFDVHYSNVEIAIASSVLLQTGSDSLRTDAFTVTANIEPVVSSVDIPNAKMKVGDTVDVFLYLDVTGIHADSVFELTSGNVGGYPLFSLEKKAGNEYWSKFTVTQNQQDFYAIEDIPVNNLRLDDAPVTGVTYNGDITGNDQDMIDSRIPVVGTLSLIGTGPKKIGDQVILLIAAFEEGLFVEDSSTINSIPITSPNVSFDPIGGGSYTFTYEIQGNDPNVAAGALEAKIHLRDTAGNINQAYPAILANNLSIDAAAPQITSVTNSTPGDTAIIGSTVTLSLAADGTDYVLAAGSHINGVAHDKLGLVHAGGGVYTVSYTVKEGDQVVTAGNLTASISMQDPAGNKSSAVTTIQDNDINVFTVRPTARLTGSDEICLNDTAQLFIALTGTSPWTIRYTDATTSYYIYDIPTDDYTLKITPTNTTTYQIEEVVDGTGNSNTGIGTSLVTVNALPVVDILNLDPVYSVEVATFTLQGSPVGGTFTGPGVITAEQTFTPEAAGLTGLEPHMILYEYTDANTCYWADTAYVDVVQADVTWSPENLAEYACYLNEDYYIRAVPIGGAIGQFSVPGVTEPGFLVDNGDNSATLYPAILDWPIGAPNRTVEIVFKYFKQGVEVTESKNLNIEHFDTTRITGMTETVFCSNEDPIEVFGNKEEGVYTGPGISNPVGFTFEFDPGDANIGYNRLYYNYTSPQNCVQVDSVDILVNPTPVSDYIILDTCIFKRPVGDTIRFLNTTDTAGLGALTWDWDFGDIASGLDNLSTLENPVHWYADPGNWTIELTSTTVNGCANSYVRSFSFGDKPTARFSWDTECFTSAPIEFSSSATEHTDLIETYQWIISDLSGNEILNTTLPGSQETLSHSFTAMDNYMIELRVESELQCRDNDIDTIYLRPYIQDLSEESDFYEDYEGSAPGWIAESSESSVLQSWKFGTVDAGSFPYTSVDGSKAWYTDLVRKDTIEQSWISSPCFDFSDMNRPMVKLDIKVSSDRDRDGTALQYTTNDGQTWKNVGAIDDGSVNWYNTFRILNGPGGQGEGWTGDFVFNSNPQWKKAMHDLDDLKGKSRVQFRMAYGSDGTSLENNEGVAFDNFWIGERTRIALLEHFTHSGDADSKDANAAINSLVGNNPRDVIDIQYHADVPGLADRMNEDNPAPAGARSLFYGTTDVPLTIMDGGGTSGAWIYDHTETPLDSLDLFNRILRDPGFDINLNASATGGVLTVDIELEALEILDNKEYILYTAVIEKEITDPAYAGTNGETEFQNVAKAMLPSAAGLSYLRGWNPGDSETMSFDWTIENILDEELIYVVAFIQDASSKEVYQATSNDPALWYTSVHDVMTSRELSMMVYPNPATDKAYVLFGEPQSGPVEIRLFNHLGSMVGNTVMDAGTDRHEFDVSRLARGVYFVRALRGSRILGTGKLVIVN